MTLSDEIVSEVDFVRTYNTPSYEDPYDAVCDYERVLEWASKNPDRGSQAASTALELPRSRIRTWMEGGKPDSVRGLEVARSHGWVPLTSTSPHLEAFVTLLAWTFSGGSINRNWVPSFVTNDTAARFRVTEALYTLDTEIEVKRRGDGRATEILPTTGASALGRVLVTMGAPRGEKNAAADIQLPAWLWEISPDLQRGFAKTYLLNRGHRHVGKDTMTFREERAESYLSALADFLQEVAEAPVRPNGQNVVVSAAAVRSLDAAGLFGFY